LQTIRVSALLSDDDYSLASGGAYIDMSSIWTSGMDQVTALAVIGSTLVVFGRNHIVLWADGSGSEIGISPASMEVVDTIEGTGCICRDSIQATGEGDLIFLSRHGLQSLGRVIEQKSNPLVSLTRNIRGDIQEAISQVITADPALDRVTSVHSPEEGLYIINFPAITKMFVLDTKHLFADDEGKEVFPVTTWSIPFIYGMVVRDNGDLLLGGNGLIGRYAGNNDQSRSFDFSFETGWLDFGELNHRLKIMKEMLASVSIGDGTVNWNWEFDFSGTTLTRQVTYSGGRTALFNVSEFSDGGGAGIGYSNPSIGAASGETVFAGGVVLSRRIIPAHGEGQFLKLGASVSINGFDFIIQHMSIAPKIGRMVT
jgi:hypothetical protein